MDRHYLSVIGLIQGPIGTVTGMCLSFRLIAGNGHLIARDSHCLIKSGLSDKGDFRIRALVIST